jgi:hypothetical protein
MAPFAASLVLCPMLDTVGIHERISADMTNLIEDV